MHIPRIRIIYRLCLRLQKTLSLYDSITTSILDGEIIGQLFAGAYVFRFEYLGPIFIFDLDLFETDASFDQDNQDNQDTQDNQDN